MLYIITPVSRPENLEEISNSFNDYLEFSKTPNTNIRWIIILDKKLIQSNDSDEEFVIFEFVKMLLKKLESKVRVTVFFSEISNAFVGHAHRNYFLNKIYPGIGITENDYAYFLDDDTILHPEFLENVLPILETEKSEIVVFGQNNKDNSVRLLPSKENIRVCHIDMGQYIFKINSLPTNIRFKEDDYCADGIFIEELYKHHGSEKTIVINKQLSFYNYLR